MANLSKPSPCLFLAFTFVISCDSTAPLSDGLLQVQGEVLEAGQPPAPPLYVDIQLWPTLGLEGTDSATVATDGSGRYMAELGPFPDGVDSLRIRVTQNDCGFGMETKLLNRDPVRDGGDALVLPTLALSYRLPAAQLGIGAEVCGAVVTPNMPDLIGDYARLALWIDDVSDSVRGRWRLNHSASIGDDYGYFSGSLELDRATLQLRPTQPTPCTGLQLGIPVPINSATMGVGELTGDGSCSVPNASVRFFMGAPLTELLPPDGG